MSIDLASESHLTSEMVQARIDELSDILPDSPDNAELNALCAFQAACEQYCSDWNYGDSAINESAFLEHITQLIDDCYEVKKSSKWPYHHMTMDYEAAAEEARSDYTCIELDGTTFYVR
jgi:hypothetical protein